VVPVRLVTAFRYPSDVVVRTAVVTIETIHTPTEIFDL